MVSALTETNVGINKGLTRPEPGECLVKVLSTPC